MAVSGLDEDIDSCHGCCVEHLPAAAFCLQITLQAGISVCKLNDLLLQNLHLIPMILHPTRIISAAVPSCCAMHVPGKLQPTLVWVGSLKRMGSLQSDPITRVVVPIFISQLCPGTDARVAWIEDL